MKFKKLELEDKKLFDKYINPYNFFSCEYSFATLYIWRKVCDIQYALYKNTLIIKKRDFYGNYHFMQPLGYKEENLIEIIEVLKEQKKKYNIKYLFKDLDEKFIKNLVELFTNKQKFYIGQDRGSFDYIYYCKDLMNLHGKKYHKKRNQYNAFKKNNRYKICNLESYDVKKDAIYLSEKWLSEHEKNSMNSCELDCIKETIYKMEQLKLNGIAIYVDKTIVGFSIGEKLGQNMAIIHFEKADRRIKGIYSFIVKTFIDIYFNDVKIMNRQEDLNIEGLRKSKKSYNPIKLEKKFIFDLC